MDSIDEGGNSYLYETEFGVMKVAKRNAIGHDIQTQKRIHDLTRRVTKELALELLCVPELNHSELRQYEMERVSTQDILYLGDRLHSTPMTESFATKLSEELARLWAALWGHGFAAWDFELFLQPDGTVSMVDFDTFGFRMTSGELPILLPYAPKHSETPSRLHDLQYFFQTPCFPRGFVELLQAQGCELPAECLPCERTKVN